MVAALRLAINQPPNFKMKVSASTTFLSIILAGSASAQRIISSSAADVTTSVSASPTSTVFASSAFGTATVVPSGPVGTVTTVTASSFGGPYPTNNPACIVFANGSAVAVPIPAPTGTIFLNSTAFPAPTGTVQINSTIYASGTPSQVTTVISSSRAPSASPHPSSQGFAPRQVVTVTPSGTIGHNGSHTVTIAYPSSYGGNGATTTSVAVVAYPSTYAGPFPSSLPLCSDLLGNSSATLNSSVPAPTSNSSALNQSLNSKEGDHSGASAVGMGLSVALLSAGTAVVALFM